MVDNQPTPGEREERRATNVKETLENALFRDVLGSNKVKTDPFAWGQLGLRGANSKYKEATSDEQFEKLRREGYDQRVGDAEKAGMFGDSAMPTNQDVSMAIYRQIQEARIIAKIGELESAAINAGADLGLEVPEALKGYTFGELMAKDETQLDETERDALEVGLALAGAYDRACALATTKGEYFAEFKKVGNDIARKYAEAPASE